MFKSTGFAIVSFIFLLLTFLTYLTKKRYDSIKNSLYRFLMFITLFMPILEVSYIYAIKYYLINDFSFSFLCHILCRLFLFLIILWTVAFFFYIRNLNSDADFKVKSDIKKRNVYFKIILITLVICFISCFFNIEYGIDQGIYVIKGPVVYFVYAIVSIIVLFLLITLMGSNYKKNIKLPIYLIISSVILTTIFNFYIIDLNDISYLLSLFVIGLYFTVESQDMMLLMELEEAKKNAEILNNAKTEFLSNMSHEIRTPLNTVLGFSQALLNEKKLDKKKVYQDIKNINEASENLLKLINNILDVSKIESGKEIVSEKKYYLSELLNEVNDVICEKYSNFEIKIDKKMLNVYYGDYSKLIKILVGLIESYKNYNLNIVLDVNYDALNQSLVFKIFSNDKLNDNDISINLNEFELLDIGTKNNIDNNILNIILVKKIVNLLNGRVTVINNSGYEVIVNQKSIDNELIGNIKFAKKEKENLINCQNKNVLIVDDNSVNLKLSEKIFEKFKFNITTAQTGSDCINLVRNNKYDIIFLDHMMPNMDGVETLNELKKINDELPPIIVLTANLESNSLNQYIKLGFNDYISKPVDVDKLNKILKKYIK